MNLAKLLFGGIGKAATQFVNDQVWQKIMTVPQGFPVENMFTVCLKNSGGSADMRVDGSVTPVVFEYVVPAGKCLALAEIALIIADDSITPTKFGGLGGTGLTNGITWQVVDASNSVKCDFCPLGRIKQNFEFGLATAADIMLTSGADQILVLWRSGTYGVTAILQAGWKIRITVRDNLTLLDAFQASITGSLTLNDFVASY